MTSTHDDYAGAAAAWASGAELLYGPLADALVATSPVPLGGRTILDAGAGTGAGSRSLRAVGARPLAADLVADMLRHEHGSRPPAVVADLQRLPLADRSLDGVLAPFVLNHVGDPVAVLVELARCVAPGGVVLASTFSEADRLPVKDLLDQIVTRHGWTPSASYHTLRERTSPLLASADRMAAAARASGLVAVDVVEGPIDVGLASPSDLVAYRFGTAHLAGFLARLDPAERDAVVAEAEAAVAAEGGGEPLAPVVVMLAARVRGAVAAATPAARVREGS